MTATKVHHRTRGGGSGRTHRPRRRWVGRSSYRSSLAVRPQRPTAAGKAHSRQPNGTAITDSDRKLRIFLREEGAEVADYARLIAVAFPLASARRSSGYAGQLIAAAAVTFRRWRRVCRRSSSAGACQGIWASAGLGAGAAWRLGVLG